jgi:hypothetical protein
MTFPASGPMAVCFVGFPPCAHREEQLGRRTQRGVAHSKSDDPRSREWSPQPSRHQSATDDPSQFAHRKLLARWPIQVPVLDGRNIEP